MTTNLNESQFTGVHPIPRSPDLAIVGGGIVGLWCALRAARLGLRTVVLEKATLGKGASGGFLGALMPHQPITWSPEKAFQLDALLSLELEIAQLEDKTRIACGYSRCGRLIPTQTERKRTQRPRWRFAAAENWPATSPKGQSLTWKIYDSVPDNSWLSPDAAPYGCEFDTLSARIEPRRLIAALVASIQQHPGNTQLFERTAVVSIADDGSTLRLDDGTYLTPGRIIVTAGYRSFELMRALTNRPLGRGVKGQAALVKPVHPVKTDAPIIYCGGVYVIAHDNGLLAVGSTSENDFTDPQSSDGKLDSLLERAQVLCPPLNGAHVVERWAGVRPNAAGRFPLIGPMPDTQRVIACTGGFKISFAIAHKMAEAALDFATGVIPDLPESHTPAAHVAAAEQFALRQQREA